MQTYIAILRGINVSGNRTIKMDALRQMFSDMGFAGVKSYIQSGNVIFQSDNCDDIALEERISAQILNRFGFEVPAIIISYDELKVIVDSNPYLLDKSKDANHLHITFLATKPDEWLIEKLNTEENLTDEFQFGERAVYLYCPNGYSKTKLSNGFIENRLKVTATTRNWKTCNELMALALQNV